MNIYGYVRISTSDQNQDRQTAAMRSNNVPADNIYTDVQSGKDFERPEYKKMLRILKTDDLIYVMSIDRLGRNYEEILEQWQVITKEKRVDIFVLDMPLLDTRRDKNLLGTFIADLVLQVLSFVAQNERENIRSRQAQGIAAAKQSGVRFGHAPRPLPPNFPETYTLWTEGAISTSEAAKRSGMARSTFRIRAESFKKNCP